MYKCNFCEEIKEDDDFYYTKRRKASGDEFLYRIKKCKDCYYEYGLSWKQNNPKKYQEGRAKDNAKPQRKIQRKELNKKRREDGTYREWQNNNKDKLKKYHEKRQHKNHKISNEEWENCKKYFNYECAYCGLHISEHFKRFDGELKHTDLHKEHVDHNGKDDLSNCVPACHSCNSSKYTFDLDQWYSRGNPNFSQIRKDKIAKWITEDHFYIIQRFNERELEILDSFNNDRDFDS